MSGQIVATGNVRAVDENGNQLFTDRIELSDELKAGAMSNLLLAFAKAAGWRRSRAGAARTATSCSTARRTTGCQWSMTNGCDKQPSWRVTARRVFYDAEPRRCASRAPISSCSAAACCRCRAVDPLRRRRQLGLPDPRLRDHHDQRRRGGSAATSGGIASNRDLLLSGYVYTDAAPMASAQYRALTSKGAYQ
jgi:LPS-assembly protein